ncbi:MAG: rhodanese-like domain-containing protein [Anaerolineales bacterium]|nr:rhodanese-like domain-containing protein [Anaerolineales bacterium]
MKKPILLTAIFFLTTLACNAIASPQTPPQADSIQTPISPSNLPRSEADVPRISLADAKAAYDSASALFVDTRGAEAYVRRHIRGALSIPLEKFETQIENLSLDKNQRIITYCT